MEIIDSILVISDSKSDKPLYLLNIKNMQYLKSIGERGKGPGEFIGLYSVCQFKNKIWAYDLTLGKLVSFDLDSVLDSNSNYKFTDEIILKDKARRSYSPVWLNDNLLVSPTMSDSDYRLLFSNNNGNLEKERFKMIPSPPNGVPNNIHNQAYHGVMKKHPTDEKLVIVDRYSDLIELYNLQDSTSIHLKTHGDYEPSYVVDDSGGFLRMAQNDDMRFGYIDVSVTQNMIFTIFSGKTRQESSVAYAGNTVILFDWKGNYLSSFITEENALAIQAMNDKEFIVIEMESNGMLSLKKYKI
jgi:hypothetical protein